MTKYLKVKTFFVEFNDIGNTYNQIRINLKNHYKVGLYYILLVFFQLIQI